AIGREAGVEPDCLAGLYVIPGSLPRGGVDRFQNLQRLRTRAGELIGLERVRTARRDGSDRWGRSGIQPAQALLLKGIKVGEVRPAHHVHVVAILVGRAAGAERCRVAVHRVRMPETEPVTEFVSRHAQLEIAVDPGLRGATTDCRKSPEVAVIVLRESI